MTERSPVAAFFDANSVAVIGASGRPEGHAGRPLHYLARYGFRGTVLPVNPKYNSLEGFECYPDVASLPIIPELAVITLQADRVVKEVGACGRHGVRSVVVFANGFADSGDTQLQQDLVSTCAQYGIRLLGPNCLGCLDTRTRLTASFTTLLQRSMFDSGPISLVTQSGSVGNSILMEFRKRSLGLSRWVATGNEADLGVLDFVADFVEDTDCSAVAVYAEAFKDGSRWPELADRARDLGKSLVVLKAGIGRDSEAVASHSGKLTGSHDLWRAIARDYGIVAVETPAELVDCTYLLARQRFTTRPSVAFVGSGGHGVMFADTAERTGVVLSRLRPETTNSLVTRLPKEASVGNPIDPTPVPDSTYFAAVEAVLTDPDVNAAVVQVTSLSRDYDGVAEHVRHIFRESATRDAHLILTYYAPSDKLSDQQQKDVQDSGAFVIESPTRVATALGAISAAFGTDRHASPPPTHALDRSLPSVLGWEQIAPILDNRGLATAPSAFVASPSELLNTCADLGWPVVLKLETPAAPHKSDLRLVEMGIETSDAASAAYERLERARLELGGAILVQHQLRSGVEILLGFRRDPEFGPSLVIGSGGVNAELLEDTITALCPIDPGAVRRLLLGTRVGRLLEAPRASTSHDVEALVELVAASSNLFVELDWLELEFNPVIVQGAGLGCAIVDALGVPC